MEPVAVSAQARANFYGLTRELSIDEKVTATVVDDISPQLVDPVPDERPGTQPEEFYASAMAGWRLALRAFVMTNLETESRWLAAMQVRAPDIKPAPRLVSLMPDVHRSASVRPGWTTTSCIHRLWA